MHAGILRPCACAPRTSWWANISHRSAKGTSEAHMSKAPCVQGTPGAVHVPHAGAGGPEPVISALKAQVKLRVCREPQALCVCPTRELVAQNQAVLEKMGKFTGISCISTATANISISRYAPSSFRSHTLRPLSVGSGWTSSAAGEHQLTCSVASLHRPGHTCMLRPPASLSETMHQLKRINSLHPRVLEVQPGNLRQLRFKRLWVARINMYESSPGCTHSLQACSTQVLVSLLAPEALSYCPAIALVS